MLETLMGGMFSPEWFAALSGIILLDLVLSGDNAILIALACKNLPEHNRGKAIVIGGLGAVLIRIICTLFATGLLSLPYLEAIGGVLLLYIAVKLLTDHKGESKDTEAPASFGAAIRTILIADFIMSIDNVLSLAGVANTVPDGKWSLIICGLVISIPIVLFGAQFFLMLMKKIPALIYAGAALLGYTAAELISADKGIGGFVEPYELAMKIGFVALVLGIGWYLNHKYGTQAKADTAA